MDKITNLKLNRNIVETFEVPYRKVPICCMCKNSYIESFNDYISKEKILLYLIKMKMMRKKKKKNNKNNFQ